MSLKIKYENRVALFPCLCLRTESEKDARRALTYLIKTRHAFAYRPHNGTHDIMINEDSLCDQFVSLFTLVDE